MAFIRKRQISPHKKGPCQNFAWQGPKQLWFAERRSVPGQQELDIFRLSQIHLSSRRLEPSQIAVWVHPILRSGLDEKEDHLAALGPAGCVSKQEILPVNDKGLYATFSPLVALLQSSIPEIVEQIPGKLC